MKFKKLSTAIEMTNCSMDDPDYRWVEHKIEEYENQLGELEEEKTAIEKEYEGDGLKKEDRRLIKINKKIDQIETFKNKTLEKARKNVADKRNRN